MRRNYCLFAVLAIVSFVCPGCFDDGPPLGTVSGTVTLDGSPLAGAQVQFQPEAVGRPSFGVTDSAGLYEVGYSFDRKGAALGQHQVSITTAGWKKLPDGNEVPVAEKLPKKYHEKTELTATVVGGRNELNFDLKSKP